MCAKDETSDLSEFMPKLIANLRTRHPELVADADDETISRQFTNFHDIHDMTRDALAKHLGMKSDTPKAT